MKELEVVYLQQVAFFFKKKKKKLRVDSVKLMVVITFDLMETT